MRVLFFKARLRLLLIELFETLARDLVAFSPRTAKTVSKIPVEAMAARGAEKEKGVAVQVLLRCRYKSLINYNVNLWESCWSTARAESLTLPSFFRPFNEEEKRAKTPQVISCNDARREVTVFQNIASKQIDRTFTFDKVSLFLMELQ